MCILSRLHEGASKKTIHCRTWMVSFEARSVRVGGTAQPVPCYNGDMSDDTDRYFALVERCRLLFVRSQGSLTPAVLAELESLQAEIRSLEPHIDLGCRVEVEVSDSASAARETTRETAK